LDRRGDAAAAVLDDGDRGHPVRDGNLRLHGGAGVQGDRRPHLAAHQHAVSVHGAAVRIPGQRHRLAAHDARQHQAVRGDGAECRARAHGHGHLLKHRRHRHRRRRPAQCHHRLQPTRQGCGNFISINF